MAAYYNEIDPAAAQWLRNLIDAGHIAPGYVDERSIEDVYPSDLHGFTQCHFFAGVGVWSHALRSAGWGDERPVWTGSCPCQPFSAAGKGAGFDDERHLWPAFHHLIKECAPAIVIGEQVASKDSDPWIDLVHTDLEAMGYAFGAIPFPSAGIGAPHIRDRLYWVADAAGGGWRKEQQNNRGRNAGTGTGQAVLRAGCRDIGGLADHHGDGCQPGSEGSAAMGHGQAAGADCGAGGMADNDQERRGRGQGIQARGFDDWSNAGRQQGDDGLVGIGEAGDGARPTGPTNGFWRAADWLLCRDGKWRPVEPSPQPLVDGSSESLGRVRPEVIAKIEEEVNAFTVESQISRAEAMRMLLENLGAEAKRCWPLGGVPGLHEASFLLAFLRQLQEQGWKIAEGISLPRPETAGGALRGMRCEQTAASASHRRGLDKQQPGEFADPVCFLSCLLARHAQEAWGDAHAAHAEIGFPLTHGARSRVARLRGYGNAINAKAAQAFIECLT
jgi:hypothetical protein